MYVVDMSGLFCGTHLHTLQQGRHEHRCGTHQQESHKHPVIPTSKEDHEFEANLGYLVKLSCREKKNLPLDLVQAYLGNVWSTIDCAIPSNQENAFPTGQSDGDNFSTESLSTSVQLQLVKHITVKLQLLLVPKCLC